MRIARVGDLQPPLVSPEETAIMVQQLKASLPVSTDDLGASGRVGGSSQCLRPFAIPLPAPGQYVFWLRDGSLYVFSLLVPFR